MKQKTKVKLLGWDIEVNLYDKASDGIDGRCVTEGNKFVIDFFGLVNNTTLIHECWHMMFFLMGHIDGRTHDMGELSNEIYAYTFSEFCAEVLDKVTHLSLYHKIWDEKHDKSRED